MSRNLKKCDRCEMYGGNESFADKTCKGCERVAELEKKIGEQWKRIEEIDRRLMELMKNKEMVEKEDAKYHEEYKLQIKKIEERLNKTEKTDKRILQTTLQEKTEEWSNVVKKGVDKELKEINEKVNKAVESIELHNEEEKLKERKKNNIVLHRLAEQGGMQGEERVIEDRKLVLCLLNDVLEVPCEEKMDIKNIYRIGKYKEGEMERPILIEFRNVTIKNRVMESLSKLRKADEKFKRVSVTHDMTKTEREQCRGMVEECREKQIRETSGNWVYKVRGLPGDMRIIRLKRN